MKIVIEITVLPDQKAIEKTPEPTKQQIKQKTKTSLVRRHVIGLGFLYGFLDRTGLLDLLIEIITKF